MTALEQVYSEAKRLLADKQFVAKSESGAATMLLIVRLLEALIYDEVRTPWPSKIHHPEDLEPSGPAVRRL